MLQRLFPFAALALAAATSLVGAAAQTPPPNAPLPPLDLGGVREEHRMIPMRDGVRLSAYLYFPPGEGPWPVLYQQRYAALTGTGTRQAHARMAAAGYVVCAENFRGAYRSEGTWQGYRALGWGELRDGYDTCEWLAAQPWSNGKVGTWGGSQAGYAQNFLAVTRPPHLVAQYMTDTGLSLFQEGYRIGGTTRPERFKAMDEVCRVPQHNRALLAEWFAHPTYDDYWKAEDCSRHFARMDVPCFTVGSWFDHYLKGVENGVEREPKVRYYAMGAVGEAGAPGNEWRTAPDWPVPARTTAYYLQPEGELLQEKPRAASSSTRFKADPLHPAEIPGRAFPGARDARAFESQAEVRTFTTPVLKDPVEWTGKVTTELFVSSNAPDTDFIVRVSDVYPDGRSILLIDYVRRARYGDGFEREVFMKPGQVRRLAFQVGWLSQVFNRGHRIRVTVASTGAPFYEPNPNTGEPLTVEWPARTLVAENAVHHDRRYASRVIAPVVP